MEVKSSEERKKKRKKPNTYTMESRCFEPPRETKIGSKNRIQFEKSGLKFQYLIEREGNDFWFELSGGSKK